MAVGVINSLTSQLSNDCIQLKLFFFPDNESSATHIVYDEQDPLDDEFARGVLKRDKQTLFHFYYLPDSHDSWASNIELDYEPPESPAFAETTWKVKTTVLK